MNKITRDNRAISAFSIKLSL